MPKGFAAQRWGPAYVPSAVSSVASARPTERLHVLPSMQEEAAEKIDAGMRKAITGS